MRFRHLRVSATALCVTIIATLAVTGCEWGTFHGNREHSGVFPSNASVRTLQKFWAVRLDGAVYASPLVHNGLVYVATEGGTVYAFTTTGALRWRTHLANPVRLSDLATHGAPCGNIDPLGITGTPVYDPTTNRLFAVAETLVQGTIQHHLVALNPSTGAVLGRRLVSPPRGNEAAHQQRGALAITAGRVLVPYGGLSGDCGNYVGSIVGTRTDLTGAQVSYAIPTTREGAFWNTPGPLVLPDGSVLEASGNGASTSGRYDGSDSVVHLSADLHTLLDRFAPTSWAADNASDRDLGSTGPAVTSNGYVVQSGKSGITYVLRLSHLGGLGGLGGQVSSTLGCTSFGGAAVSGTTVYLPCTSGVQRADVSASGGISIRWQANGVPGSPVVYGNSVLATSQSQGRLYVLDPATGQARSSIAVGPLTRFATPALDTGRAYVGTQLGIFAVNLKA